jgi:hypothetical protein
LEKVVRNSLAYFAQDFQQTCELKQQLLQQDQNKKSQVTLNQDLLLKDFGGKMVSILSDVQFQPVFACLYTYKLILQLFGSLQFVEDLIKDFTKKDI